MGLWPLGWRDGTILYAVSNGSDTSIYTWSGGRAHFLSLLVPQVISAPSLSPDGRRVAFLAPADCTYCSLAIFDVSDLTTWFGPPGVPSEYDVAWSANSQFLITVIGGTLTAIDTLSHEVAKYHWPGALPTDWSHTMSASVTPGETTLRDTVTGHLFRAGEVTG